MATTTERKITRADSDKGSCPVAASTKVPGGTLVFFNTSGYAINAIAAGANKLLGVSYTTADNSGGANGDLTVEYWRRGQFEFAIAAATQADVGKRVYAVDNDTVSKTSTNQTYVGTISEVLSATSVMVDLDPLALS